MSKSPSPIKETDYPTRMSVNDFNDLLLDKSTVLLASLLNKYGTENSDELLHDAVAIAKKLIIKCNEL